MTTLKEHRENLKKNYNAYEFDFSRLRNTAVCHIKRSGFSRVTISRCGQLVDDFVSMIFNAQDRLPFFQIESDLPFCWNSPKDWDKNYIKYEWGHLYSINQNNNVHNLENLCLQSARCNQHIQTSMDIIEVAEWISGSKVEERILRVLESRRHLFASPEWQALLNQLKQFR